MVVSHICRVAMNGHCNWACLQTNVPTLKRNPTEKLDFLIAQKKWWCAFSQESLEENDEEVEKRGCLASASGWRRSWRRRRQRE